VSLYGFFSLKQREFGSFIYRKIDGTEVEVTEVTESNKPFSRFDDTTYVGKVTEFIRNARSCKYRGYFLERMII